MPSDLPVSDLPSVVETPSPMRWRRGRARLSAAHGDVYTAALSAVSVSDKAGFGAGVDVIRVQGTGV